MEYAMSRFFRRAFATVATAALLTGCGPEDIGPKAEKDELKGDIKTEQVFTGGPLQTHTTLSARFLEAGESYAVEGKLTINGDIPEKTSITVHNGELVVNGSVGNESRLTAEVPLVTHRQSYSSVCTQYNAALKMTMTLPCTKYKTVIDGLRYDDPDPAITITGRTGEDVSLRTQGGINVRGRTVQAGLNVAPSK
jgi:hypothetical protein